MRARLFPFFLALLLVIIPAGHSFATPTASRSLLTTVYKRAPQKLQSHKKPQRAAAPPLSTFSKRKPVRRHLSPAFLRKRLTAKSVYVMDAVTGEPLYAKSPDLKRQPASTLKILTGILALQHLKDNDKVRVSRRAAGMPRSKVYLKTSHQYRATDLINALLLASANDASVALAEKIAGSELKFARLMTKKAKELGARNTVARTASGLTARGQYSTARDLAVIFNRIMKDSDFAQRMRKTRSKMREGITLRNHNKALWQIPGAEGGKTGFTRAARQTYVGKFKRGKDEILVAIMGSRTMWQDIKRLVEYGFSKKEELRMARTTSPGQEPRETTALNGAGNTIASR